MNANEIISSGLLELFVLGQTNPQEEQLVLEWKAKSPEVAAELLAIEDHLVLLDQQRAVMPSANVKQQLLQRIANEENAQASSASSTNEASPISQALAPVVSIQKKYKWAVAAAIALLMGSIAFNIYLNTKLGKTSNALAKAEKAQAASAAEIAALQKTLEVPFNNNSQQVVLKGTPYAPTSTAKIFWIKNTNEVYIEPNGLPEAPSGFGYQLWAIVDGKPVDGGMITIDKGKKYNFQKMKSFGKVEAFAITIEKATGSSTPTLEKMVVISTI